ncbi:Pyridine nucleotide transhydrogenase [Carpediemonas membranifera]|uniref:proton-translocating NAD(P)(+) transhydrogenase n=1 Tax=Carpediemonas membranifera TaxID=201153 RepID=A0A8J6ASP8_9EUKA|nr:Pyridine nucleotide transhydrogenase [Carpediemonas membranifera]|eukprot:KAG9390525.1 Pyridine nucleotide transhydrogenase [Carpediemonas membranifera]
MLDSRSLKSSKNSAREKILNLAQDPSVVHTRMVDWDQVNETMKYGADNIVAFSFVPSAALFIFAIVGLSKQSTAARGNMFAIVGMLIAILAVLYNVYHVNAEYWSKLFNIVIFLILAGAGSTVGVVIATSVKMTGMPQMVGLLNSFGGLAAVLEGFAFDVREDQAFEDMTYVVDLLLSRISIVLGVLIGTMTFVGSIWACLKLMGKPRWLVGQPRALPFRNAINVGLGIIDAILAIAFLFIPSGEPYWYISYAILIAVVIVSTLLSTAVVLAIGGADMPVVISILNSGSGWSGALTGLTLRQDGYLMIITGSIVGSSGAILAQLMCVAMNRTLLEVIKGGVQSGGLSAEEKRAQAADQKARCKTIAVEDLSATLVNCKKILIVPGYGLAVARAQRPLVEAVENLRSVGVNVTFGIHPVAGRLPGHMNILLAEAACPYNIVKTMDEVNPEMESYDAAIIIGANDTVNRDINMPVVEVWRSKAVFVIKRSLSPGYAGVTNPIFVDDNARMLFADAAKCINDLRDGISKLTAGMAKAEDTTEDLDEEETEDTYVYPEPRSTIYIPRELAEDEDRIAMSPENITRLRKIGFHVKLQTGCGVGSNFPDHLYEAVGGEIVQTHADAADAEVVLKVNLPTREEAAELFVMGENKWRTGARAEVYTATKVGPMLISFMNPGNADNKAMIEFLAEEYGVHCMCMERIPRTSRAQKMDALSSTANLAGYRACIEACNSYRALIAPKITAAGKTEPAEVLVIGAGVAGLSAIGTMRAMGAVVRAFDIRSVVKDEVKSMGAEFLEVDMDEDGAGAGGYAQTASEEFLRKEYELFHKQCKRIDIIITTAAIPNRKSPIMIKDYMVADMKPGAVIVDLAAAGGGNCELTRPGEKYVTDNGVTIIGYTDLASRMAAVASELYATNMFHILDTIADQQRDAEYVPPEDAPKAYVIRPDFVLPMEDDVIGPMTLTHNGEVMPEPKRPVGPPPSAGKVAEVVQPEVEEVAGKVPMNPQARFTLYWALPFAAVVIALLLSMFVPYKSPKGTGSMQTVLLIFALSVFIGVKIIGDVHPSLHTPLMSVTNAISGIVVLGGMMLLDKHPFYKEWTVVVGAIAIFISMVNVAGGFLITGRMLNYFKSDAPKELDV